MYGAALRGHTAVSCTPYKACPAELANCDNSLFSKYMLAWYPVSKVPGYQIPE